MRLLWLTDQNGNPLNTYGSAANIPIADGTVPGYDHINKFGYDDAVGTTAYETIWDGSSIYSYISTPGPASVSSTDGGDTGILVDIQGLDQDYNLVSETVVVGSTGSVNFSRVFRAAGGSDHAGNIEITVDSAVRVSVRHLPVRPLWHSTLFLLVRLPISSSSKVLLTSQTVKQSSV